MDVLAVRATLGKQNPVMTTPMSGPARLDGSPPESQAAPAQRVPRTEIEDARIADAFQKYFGLVWRFLRRFGVSEAGADDAAQSVFLVFAERLRHISPGSERAFLLSSVRRIAANARRRDARLNEVSLLDDQFEFRCKRHDPEVLLEEKQRLAELDRGLASLSADQRTVFVLYELEGLSLPEIALVLGIPLGTATSRLLRGRKRFEAWVTTNVQS